MEGSTVTAKGGKPAGELGGGDENEDDPTIVQRAAKGDIDSESGSQLLDYFLGNEELPGDDRTIEISFEVDAGGGGRNMEETWEFKRISFDQWKDCIKRSTDPAKQERDPYMTAAWIVARALVHPKLGPILTKMKDASSAKANSGKKTPKDAPQLLMQMFDQQSGILFELSDKVLEYSRLSDESGTTRILDEEVEAGKI